MKGLPPATLELKPGDQGTCFDLDYFGHDDGADTSPESAFRLIFQLGAGYMIYRYEIRLSRPGALAYSHSFSIKDCAVAYVEPEDLGAPSSVEGGPLLLPVVYPRLTLHGAKREERYEVSACRFEARSWPQLTLQMFWGLYSLEERKPATLVWTNTEGWGLTSQGRFRALSVGERVLFHEAHGRAT